MQRNFKNSFKFGQQGAAMIVALVLLTVIGMGSAAVMRNAISSDQQANNLRLQSLAAQYAELGLRYCERQLLISAGVVPTQTEPTSGYRWSTFSNWFGVTKTAVSIPASLMVSANSSFTLTRVPECMAESETLVTDGTKVVIVTARGFSPDYTEDSSGRPLTGSVVWLQTTIRLA